MKEVTITSFGLVIAYLLPGLLGLYGLSFWSTVVRTTFSTFLTAESSVGLFLVVVLASLIVGMFAHGIRWIIFEILLCRSYRINASVYASLSGERKLSAFRTAIDELYRYHQWWGGAAVVAPIGFIGWLLSPDASAVNIYRKVALIIGFLILELLTIFAAWRLWGLTVLRLGFILKGESNNMGGIPSPSPSPCPQPSPSPTPNPNP